METINQFLQMLEQYIQELVLQQQKIIEQNIPEKAEIRHKISQIEELFKNPNSIKHLNMDVVSQDDCMADEYNNISAIISFINITNSVPQEYQKTLLTIFSNILDRLKNKLNNFSGFSNQETNDLDQKIRLLENLKNKVTLQEDIQEIDLNNIIDICVRKSMTEEDIANLLADIALISMDKIYMEYDTLFGEENLDVEIIKQNQILLTEKELTELFNHYNYDFSQFSQNSQNLLKRYGNIEKIRSILDVFASFKIDLNVKYKNSTIFKSASNSLCKILLYSNADYSKDIIEEAAKYGILLDLGKGLPEFIKNSGAFFPRRRRYLERTPKPKKEKNPESNNNEKIDTPMKEKYKIEILGALDDFKLNMSLIYDIYKNIKYNGAEIDDVQEGILHNNFIEEIYSKHPGFFIQSYEKHLNTINQFDIYGIDKEKYISCLSSFRTVKFADKLDQFIELDCIDYVKDNLSGLLAQGKMDSLDKLIIVKQILHLSNSDIFTYHKDKKMDSNKLVIKQNLVDEAISNSKKSLKDLARFSVDESLQKRFDYLTELISEEYKLTESTFFNKYESRIQLLNSSAQNLTFYNTLDSKYTDSDNALIYRINGVPVSKYKVQRIYDIFVRHNISDSFDNLLFALTYQSNYTQEQFDILKTELNKVFNGGEMHI